MGIYLWDTYDFNGHQVLGYWSTSGARQHPFSGGDLVTNGDFRDWRNRHGRGGDFFVYSDVRTVSQRETDSFVV